ncbi:MAG: UbiD family decarboxylase [Bryobacteraceae bacterium]
MSTDQSMPRTISVRDLRSAIDFLSDSPKHLYKTSEPVDPYLELAGVYRVAGAGTPAPPPTQIGPAMLFENVRGYPETRILVGMFSSRERTALLLGTTVDRLPFRLMEAVEQPIPTVLVSGKTAPCQEVIHRDDADLTKLLPIPTLTAQDAGPYLTLGLVRAEDPETGQADVTIHRMCVLGPDRLSIYFVPGRHIGEYFRKAEERGQSLPVSISIGLDPAVYVAACFEPPTTPLGFDELSIAGALRGSPVELAPCGSVAAKAIAHAEIVIEGEILPGVRVPEDERTGAGNAMPEFPGYEGKAQASVPVIQVRAITHRKQPILQTLVSPGSEHVNLVGIPTEASIFRLVEDSMPGRLLNVYAHPAGGGKYVAVLRFRKAAPSDEGRQRQAALTAFAVFPELKHVILVDEDVNIFDSNDVMWAMTTRYQGDASTVFIPGVRCHPLDPSESPDFSPSIHADGISCKTIFDCTVPYAMKNRFVRAPFAEVDVRRFFPDGVVPGPAL